MRYFSLKIPLKLNLLYELRYELIVFNHILTYICIVIYIFKWFIFNNYLF